MRYLTILSPVEVLFLTKETSKLNDYLKFTFLDLVVKDVLRIIEKKNVNTYDSEQLTYYVKTGEKFSSYKRFEYEKFFLFTFDSDKKSEISLSDLIKIASRKSFTSTYFKQNLLKTPNLSKCYKQNFFQKLANTITLSKDGIEIKKALENEIQELNKLFSIENEIHTYKILNLLNTIGACIYLVENNTFETLNKIDAEFKKCFDNDRLIESSIIFNEIDNINSSSDFESYYSDSSSDDGGDSGGGGSDDGGDGDGD